jgi:hypothetical protein
VVRRGSSQKLFLRLCPRTGFQIARDMIRFGYVHISASKIWRSHAGLSTVSAAVTMGGALDPLDLATRRVRREVSVDRRLSRRRMKVCSSFWEVSKPKPRAVTRIKRPRRRVLHRQRCDRALRPSESGRAHLQRRTRDRARRAHCTLEAFVSRPRVTACCRKQAVSEVARPSLLLRFCCIAVVDIVAP